MEQVSKTFRLPHQRYSTLKERALHPFTTRGYDAFRALEDVTFDVKRGEFFGVVGRNGAGKSTLLKCLAGVYGADAGQIDVVGRVSPFIELGVGFNPDLTARDNVVINAVMLWLTSATSDLFGLRFHVDGFGAAFVGALIITVVSFALSLLVGPRRERRYRVGRLRRV